LDSTLSGFAKITHPFHPFHGQRFPVLKKRRVSGIDTLILQGSCLGTFAVPQEWTDKGNPPVYKPRNTNPPFLDFRCLLDLRQLLKKLIIEEKKRVDNEIK
jgi:hypothetical protein